MNLRRRSEATQATVSLFPFLAVLLCTMGALLVLLVVMARQARSNAALEKAEAIRKETLEEAGAADETSRAVGLSNDLTHREAELAELGERVANLAKMQGDGQTHLDETQRRLGHAETHLRELADQLASAYTTAKKLAKLDENRLANRQKTEAELAQLAEMIRDTETEIDAARDEAIGQPKSYAIVPYQGPHGTHRRPIYVECRDDAILLQPEGIELPADDFRDPIGPGNPLASALRAARDYHTAKLSDPNAVKAQPYPLLLVRPDGILAYYHAREAIASWGPDFGYELIDGDWELSLPPADPQLAHLLYRTVETARARQRALAQAAPRRFHGSGGAGGSTGNATGSGGGQFTVEVDQLPGQESPLGDYRPGRGDEHPGSWSPGEGREAATGESHGNGTGRGQAVGGNASSGGRERLAGESGPSLEGDAPRQGDWQAEPEGGGQAFAGSASGGGRGGSAPPSRPSAEEGGHGATDASGRKSGLAAGDRGEQRAAGGNLASNPSPTSNAARTATSSASSSGPSSSGAASQSAASGSVGGAGMSSRGTPGGSASVGSAGSSSAAQMSGNSAPHWPEPKRAPGAVPIRRAIHIVVRRDRLAILPEPGAGGGRVVRVEGDVDASMVELADAMREHMRGWGMAGRGLYWKPILVLKPAPDGAANAARMVRRLRGSGIEIQTPGGTLR